MNKLNKGFTLIELLVVIAIIGILSSVVLANLNTARGKAADIAIKSNLNSARAQAALYYDTAATNTFVGVCAALASATPGGILTMRNAATAAGSATTACADAVETWAMSASLKSTPTVFYCVDSTGKVGTAALVGQACQ